MKIKVRHEVDSEEISYWQIDPGQASESSDTGISTNRFLDGSCKCYNTFKKPTKDNYDESSAMQLQRSVDGHPGDESDAPPVEEDLPEKPLLWTQIVVYLGASFILLMNSTVDGFTGITLTQITNPNSSDIYLNDYQAAVFSSIKGLGNVIGAGLSGFLIVSLGHRLAMLSCIPVSMLGWIILSRTNSYAILIFVRVLHGVMNGVQFPTSQLYLVEICHPNVRGRLVTACTTAMQFGFFFVYFVGGSGLSWRDVALICGLSPAILPFIIFFFLPDSPRWLATKERFQEVYSSLIFFRGKGYQVDPEFDAIKRDIREKGRSVSILDQLRIVKDATMIKRIVVISLILFLSAFQGNVTIVHYTSTIFKLSNTGQDEYANSIISSTTRFLGSCLCPFLLGKCGRKLLMVMSQTFAGLCMALFSLFLYLQTIYGNSSYISWMPLTSLLAFNFFIGIFFPFLAVICTELLPNSVRAIAAGILCLGMEFWNFIAVLTFQYMVDGISLQWTFLFYAINCFLGAMIVAFFIPETKGKTLEEI